MEVHVSCIAEAWFGEFKCIINYKLFKEIFKILKLLNI